MMYKAKGAFETLSLSVISLLHFLLFVAAHPGWMPTLLYSRVLFCACAFVLLIALPAVCATLWSRLGVVLCAAVQE